MFLAPVAAARADTRSEIVQSAALFLDGKGLAARARLRKVARASADDPAVRAAALELLLDICLRMQAGECLKQHTQAYLDATGASLSEDSATRTLQVLRAGFYLNADRLAIGGREAIGEAVADQTWTADTPATGLLYLRRRALRVDVLLAARQPEAADRALSEVLAIAASVTTPRAYAYEYAAALADALGSLVELGEYERAYGIYTATAGFVQAALPPRTPEALRFHRTAAVLLEAVDDGPGALRESEALLAALPAVELDVDTRDWLLGGALSLKAALCQEPGCGAQALQVHPFAPLYRTQGRAPASVDEVAYLAARAITAQVTRTPDAVAAAALAGRLGFTPDPSEAAIVEAYRQAGMALAAPPGPAKNQAFAQLGRHVRTALATPGVPGAWTRPGVFDRLLIDLAMIPAVRESLDPETTFALFQLAGLAGPGFEADAMTLLASARGASSRQAAHDGLRLRARRDRAEQLALGKVGEPADPAAGFAYDSARLAELSRLNEQLAASDKVLATAGVATSGANLVTLKRVQEVLADGEAALAYAPVGGELAYACVRRDALKVFHAPADTARAMQDARLLQAALSATHAPSEELDTQFPVSAAVRLYDVFLRPFEACLKPGDRVIWISPLVSVGGLPLSALLPAAPPRAGEGFDLAAARWFVRDHAISYAGSASALVASRTAERQLAARDFLGVGDPVLDGEPAAAIRKAGLGPLPDTRTEIAASARPFQATRVLVGEAATEGAVREALAEPARLISFATHGVMRDEIEGLSEPAIVLTPGGGADGLLTASDIADFRLAATFVALSACNTANLEFTRIARDLPALASAFTVAGVPDILGTLWAVNSETGATIVAGVFERLAASAPPAVALAEAQRAFLDHPPAPAYRHPRFWSPFIVIGDGGISGPVTPPRR